jgi:hypothetical protein
MEVGKDIRKKKNGEIGRRDVKSEGCGSIRP